MIALLRPLTLASKLHKPPSEKYRSEMVARKAFDLFEEIVGGNYAND